MMPHRGYGYMGLTIEQQRALHLAKFKEQLRVQQETRDMERQQRQARGSVICEPEFDVPLRSRLTTGASLSDLDNDDTHYVQRGVDETVKVSYRRGVAYTTRKMPLAERKAMHLEEFKVQLKKQQEERARQNGDLR